MAPGTRGCNTRQENIYFFLDPDDWLQSNALELLYNKAIKTDADIVLTGSMQYDQQTGALRVQRSYQDMESFIKIDENNFIKTFTAVCYRLYKHSFLIKNHLKFAEYCFFEDNSWGSLVAILAKKVSFIREQVYFYRVRNDSTTGDFKINKTVFGWVDDYKYFISFIKKAKIKSNIIGLAIVRYLFKFSEYYERLSRFNKIRFFVKIKKEFSCPVSEVINYSNCISESQKNSAINFLHKIQRLIVV